MSIPSSPTMAPTHRSMTMAMASQRMMEIVMTPMPASTQMHWRVRMASMMIVTAPPTRKQTFTMMTAMASVIYMRSFARQMGVIGLLYRLTPIWMVSVTTALTRMMTMTTS